MGCESRTDTISTHIFYLLLSMWSGEGVSGQVTYLPRVGRKYSKKNLSSAFFIPAHNAGSK